MENEQTLATPQNKVMTRQSAAARTRLLAGVGMLTAASVVLQYLEFPIPVMPPFIKFDFSDLPALLGAFAYGPVAGVLIEFLKNLIHCAASQSATVGELSNFITGVIYVGTAGLIYRKFRTTKGAAASMAIATLVLAAVSVPVNAFITLPLYGSMMNFPIEAIVGMSAEVNPLVKDKITLLLAVFVPFNLFKGIVVGLITFLVYKPISKLVNKTYDETHAKQ